jgi:2-amino-4-hydroxy-6-hydroxymethyldihydropteridine diphosphokinase
MPTVYIALGSNIGAREANCRRAVDLLAAHGVRPLKLSSMHETEPWGIAEQPRFINMAVEAETALPPRELLKALKDIEREMGRVATVKWGPRVIDLDIIFYGSVVIKEPGLEIPHPRMHERGFVLAPLAEVAPDFVHPVLGQTVRELYGGLTPSARNRRRP